MSSSLRTFFWRSLFLGLSLPLAASVPVSLNINATQPVRTVDERVFGLNTAVWDDAFKSSQTLPLLQACDTRVLRFPGGSTSDAYVWQSNKTYDTTTGLLNNFTWGTSFDDFAQVATSLHAQAFITVNYGSATAQDAADWVTYSNVTKHYGFKYWEIGNECYGSWEYDRQVAAHDPTTYANRAGDYITKMKAADSTIKVGVVVVTGTGYNNWNAVMLGRLKALGATPDFVIYHRYEQTPLHDTDLAHAESDAGLLQKAQTWPSDAVDIRQQVNTYLGAVGPGVELVVTENNSVYAYPGKQTTSLVNGLFLADSTGNILQTEFNSLVWWDLHNGQETGNNNSAALYGWRNYGDYGILAGDNQPYPTYYVMKLLAHFARGGDTVVAAASNNTLLSLFAAKRGDGSLSLLVINKDPVNDLSANIALTGFTPGSTATTYTYGKPQDSGQTDIATGSTGIGGPAFTATFASYSVTVISLNAAVPAVAPVITAHPGNQTVNAGGAAMFTAAASGTPTPTLQWQRLPAGSGTWTNVSEGGNYSGSATTTLTVSSATAGMDGDQFRCVATSSAGSATSNAAALSIIVAPSNAVVSITVE